MPAGCMRFNRIIDKPGEVCFGFLDGNVEELRHDASKSGHDDRLRAFAQFVESVGTDRMSELVEDVTPRQSTSG